MYIWEHRGLGENSFSQATPTTLRMRPKPFLKLDWFDFDKSSLTPRLADMVNKLADTAVQSLNSPQPIETIRLIGHTDSTGTEKYNVGLGDRRANTVAALLRDKLKALSGRIKIVVEPSPGETDPTADNGTAEGQGLNRRVEVFIKTGVVVPPKPKPPINLWDPNIVKPPPEPIIRTKPEPYWTPIPPGAKGKSFKEWLDGKLKDYRVPKILRDKIWDAIFDKNWGLLSNLLGAAGISGPVKESIIETARGASEGKAR
jgi:hypothetical protein